MTPGASSAPSGRKTAASGKPRDAHRPAANGTTMADEAYRVIKQRIVRLEFAPGSAFSESELSRDLGLSKTPVREALARLQREQLVQVAARSGYHVAPVTLKDTRDLFALRTLLEGEAAALAASSFEDASRLRELEELCQSSYSPDDDASIDEFLVHNTRFHTTVAELAGNARLARVLQEVLEQLERVFHLGLALSSRSHEIVHEHSDLVAAILAGDADAARDIAVSQARASQKMVIDALLASDVLGATNLVPLHLAPRS